MEIQRALTGIYSGIPAAPKPATPAAGGFGDALGDAVKSLDGLQKEADSASTAMAAGEDVEIHDVMLAQDRASLSMQLAVQVRNKMVEAYQDIMRMQV
ncbi:MAG: flagellar hook-basal body complex protein FliE [Chloroflexota bacterium]